MSLRYEVTGSVAVITLDRPDVLNAFDDDLGRRALDAVQRAGEDADVRCIVVTGAGRAFCAGEDLGALAQGYEAGAAPELGKTLKERYNPLIRALRAVPKPVVAAINGVAAGAGVSLALACDVRIASEHAKLSLAFVKVGLVPDSGALWFLQRTVGAARAFELALTGRVLGAQKCLDLGLFDEVAPADGFEDAWRGRAAELAAGPTRAYALLKKLATLSAGATLDEALDAEVSLQTEAGLTQDHLEGVRAFLSKRPPEFQGR
jgi:2-(1,2-epoxy-1,2-dihydrophenyl)acetyl-CoA isomerase